MSDETAWTEEQWEAWRANNRRLLDDGYTLKHHYWSRWLRGVLGNSW